MRALLIRAFLERAGERATDLLCGARASKATRRERHEGKQQSTRSTASSKAASSRLVSKHVRTSCCHLGIELQMRFVARFQKFRPAALKPRQRRLPLPQEGHKATEEMVASMTSTRSTSSTKVVHCCWSGARVLIMGVSCATIGNNYSIIRHKTAKPAQPARRPSINRSLRHGLQLDLRIACSYRSSF